MNCGAKRVVSLAEAGRTIELRKGFDNEELNRIVNVTSVTLRSPFRFPGGKTWLVPQIRRWLLSRNARPTEFIEPFAGGAIVGLTVAAEALATHVLMAELDEEIAAVWHTILSKEGKWLANKIANFHLTSRALREELKRKPRSLRGKAFQTILKNRTFRGGILARSSSPLRNGERGKGVLSRWYPQTLKNRILSIGEISDRISFVEGDGMEIFRARSRESEIAFFIDPPYTAGEKKAGRRLYTHSNVDHQELFRIASKVVGDLLMTYDDAPDVRELAKTYNLDIQPIVMKNTHHTEMKELLIGHDLGWARTSSNRLARLA